MGEPIVNTPRDAFRTPSAAASHRRESPLPRSSQLVTWVGRAALRENDSCWCSLVAIFAAVRFASRTGRRARPGRGDTRSSRIGPGGGVIARGRTAGVSPPPAGVLPDEAVFQDERVELAADEGRVRLARRVDDRLAAQVERGVEEHGHAGCLTEAGDERVIALVALARDHLQPSGPVDVSDGRYD